MEGRKKVTRASLRKKYKAERKGYSDFVVRLGKLVDRGKASYGGISDTMLFLRVNEVRRDLMDRVLVDLDRSSPLTDEELYPKWMGIADEMLNAVSKETNVEGIEETREEEIERMGRVAEMKTALEVAFDLEDLL